MTGNNVVGNRDFYSTVPTTVLPKVRFPCKALFEPKVMIYRELMRLFSSNRVFSEKKRHCCSKEGVRYKMRTRGDEGERVRGLSPLPSSSSSVTECTLTPGTAPIIP